MSRLISVVLLDGENEIELPLHSNLVDAVISPSSGQILAIYQLLADSVEEDKGEENESVWLIHGSAKFSKSLAHFKTLISDEGAHHVMTWYG